MAKNGISNISQLKIDQKNARVRTARGASLLEQSLREVGAARSIVIDEEGNILAGNGTVEAAGQIGFERVQVIDADGETIIAVRRTGLTPEQKKRLSILDNRTAELAEWDPEELARAQADGLAELSELGFEQYELNILFNLYSNETDPQKEWTGMPEFDNEDQTAIQSVHIHFKTQNDIERFASLIGQKITTKTRSIWYPEAEIKRYADKQYIDE